MQGPLSAAPNIRRVLAFLLIPLVLVWGPAPVTATEDLDSVLEGFGEEVAEDGADAEVLEGFEEEVSPQEDSPGEVPAGEEAASDEILEGFETSSGAKTEPVEGSHPSWPAWISLDGHLRLAATVNTAHEAPREEETDWRGLSRLRGEGQLAAEIRLPEGWRLHLSGDSFHDLAYAINGREDYSSEVLEDYEAETELGESYIEGGLSRHLDLKAGRQVIVWGKSDNIRITDVLNPLDLRSPGLIDVADLRLPVTATRLDLHGGPWVLTAAALHEIRFNKFPSYGSDFYPAAAPPPEEEVPENSLAHTEYALALAGTFRGWDLALSWADTYSDAGHLELDPTRPGSLVRKHERTQQVGLAANWALGNWLVKAEGARIEGLRYFNAPGERFGRLDLLLGIEYGGLKDSTISIEVADRHILHHRDALKDAPDDVAAHEPQLVVRLSRDFLHQTLNLGVLASYWGFGAENGGLQRYTASYDINDALELRLGFVAYQSGERGQLQGAGDNDRLFAELTYHF